MNESEYLKILKIICKYYGIDKEEILELLKNKENRFLLILILKNNNCLIDYKLTSILGIESGRSIKNTIRKAEEKFLINSYFRKKYLELEKNIKKEMN